MSEPSYLMQILKSIQESINTLGTHNIDMTYIKHEQLIDFEKNLKLFILDSFTRCINLKKISKDLWPEQTTHCAVYFKIVPFENKYKVLKLLIAANKNSDKLVNRAKNIFNLIGMNVKNIQNKLIIEKSSNNIDPSSFTEPFLSCNDFKYSNLQSAMVYIFKILDVKDDSVEYKNNFKSYFRKWEKCFECINEEILEKTNKKFKNAFQDIALFYFYLNVFIQFACKFFIFDKTEIEIVQAQNSYLNGMHCEMQLVSRYYDKIDDNNKYISISSDCCVLCGLALKTLNLEFFGTKSNLCSSRYWKPPEFKYEGLMFQKKFEKNFYNQLKLLDDFLKHKKFKAYNTKDWDELPYSDEWIENQYYIFDKLFNNFSNENEIEIIKNINTKIITYYELIHRINEKEHQIEKKDILKRKNEADFKNLKKQKF